MLAAQWFLLLTGVGILALRKEKHQGRRGLIALILAILNIGLWLVLDNPIEIVSVFRELLGYFLMGVTAVVDWWFLIAGARTLHFRPDSGAAHGMGLIAGCVMVVLLLLPVLPKDYGYFMLAVPFKVFKTSYAFGNYDSVGVALGIIMFAMMAMLIASAILCIANTTSKSHDAISRSALKAFRLTCLVIPFPFLIIGVFLLFGLGFQTFILTAIMISKIFGIAAGLFFLMPLGISEYLLGVGYEPTRVAEKELDSGSQ